jgi:uncharacterized protein YrrD
MTTKLVKGTPVVSLADGATLGTIDHVYFDPQRLAVVGFTFHRGGGLFGTGSSGLVDISDVHAFGSDAVTVDDVSVVRSELAIDASDRNLLDLESLLNRTVMTANGTLVGRVAAIQFGDSSHRLTALDVIGEGSDDHGSIVASEIQTIGPELIIVADPAAVAPTVQLRPRRILHAVTPGSADDRDVRRSRDLEPLGA